MWRGKSTSLSLRYVAALMTVGRGVLLSHSSPKTGLDWGTQHSLLVGETAGPSTTLRPDRTHRSSGCNAVHFFGGGAFIRATNLLVNLGRSRSICACTNCTSVSGLRGAVQVSVLP